ncbi:MAG: putative lipid II flippase FtsW [Nitrospirae bacterium]|nr:putative lipid II flippase FtsW [Candidatus Manganitrophaceae bacterium]
MTRTPLQNKTQMSLGFGPTVTQKTKNSLLTTGDWILLAIVASITLIGLVMVYNASSLIGEKTYHDSLYFIKRQLQWLALSIFAFLLASRVNLDRLRLGLVPLTLLVFLLLFSVLIFGVEIKGARRWLKLGGLTFQVSELAKLFTVIYLAHYIDKNRAKLGNFLEGAMPPLILLGLMSMLILLEPDFGTTIVILCITLSLLFLGGVPPKQLLSITIVTLPFFIYWVTSSPYRLKRITTFLNPWAVASEGGYQVIQSQVALGSGGLTGTGLAGVKQVLFFLPEPHTDFIFSVFGEAFGLIGTTLIVLLFVGILWRGTKIALNASGPYRQILAIGLCFLVVLPALLNMGVATGLLPTKGLPLPFMSYGGSSLVGNSTAIGLLYNISRQSRNTSGWMAS